uniref:DUF674 domain-containing protein n=1 Tax=Aegilops tauschii TaxID=37682 RepID=M8C0U1_AEGTA
MATAAAAPPAPTMKLLIDAKAKRVLYAEAGKDAVDFLFGFLATPVGTVAKLLRAGAANIYASAEGMNPAYMQSSAVRDALLNSHRKLNGEEKGLVLEEKSVKIGQQEGLDILKASLQSSTVLTDVFMSNNSADASLSKNKRARTSGGEMSVVQEKNDKTLDYFL